MTNIEIWCDFYPLSQLIWTWLLCSLCCENESVTFDVKYLFN